MTAPLQSFFAWLLHTTWQAGVLVCLILLVQKTLGHRLGVRGRYCLWLVLLLRLALPWTPPSRVSVYNLVPWTLAPPRGYVLTAPEPGGAGSGLATSGRIPTMLRRDKTGPAAGGMQSAGSAPHLHVSQEARLQARVMVWLLPFWLAGVAALAGWAIVSHLRLWRTVRRSCPVTEGRILDLLADCRKLMGTRRAVAVVAADGLGSPALFGLIRPRLLLPRETLAALDLSELRHIFLHELAHLKRHDIVLSYAVALLHAVHWFNPLLALGLRRMRADRELVCDELALSVLAPEETAGYGRTIVHQIEQLLASRSRWMLAGLSGDRVWIRQRLLAISRFRRETRRWSPLALTLVVILAGAGLTDGLTAARLPAYGPARDLPATHQDRHANIVRIHIRHRDSGQYLLADGEKVVCSFDEPGEAGLWEARFDEDFGHPDQIVYFYSAVTGKYLTWDPEGNLAVNGLDPEEPARWRVQAGPDGNWIMPGQLPHFYVRPGERGTVRAIYGTGPSLGWEIDQLWRVKTSDNPVSNAEWRRQRVPGPDWYWQTGHPR